MHWIRCGSGNVSLENTRNINNLICKGEIEHLCNDMDDNTMNPIIIINISGTYTLTATNKWGEDTVACEVSIN